MNNDLKTTTELARNYLDFLLEARRQEAFACIFDALNAGLPVSSIYLEVLQPALYELGRLWQVNEIDIAIEHYCTAATQLLMAQIFPHALVQKRIGWSMMGACLGSELHELGMRMVSDFFEFNGWDTFFMGAVSPQESTARQVSEHRPHVLCLSATMTRGVPMVRDTITQIREEMGKNAPIILVGGLAFNINPSLYHVVDADGIAPDARATVTLATQMLSSEMDYA